MIRLCLAGLTAACLLAQAQIVSHTIAAGEQPMAVAVNEATGKAYVAMIDILPGRQAQGHSIFLLGRYDDQYVKTAQGWRIKNRVLTIASTRELGAATNATK